MTCCEMCGEATECTQKEIDGELLAICENCPIAESISPMTRVRETVESPEQTEDYQETLI